MLLVHVPHAATRIRREDRADFLLDYDTLQREFPRLTDWYTEELFTVELPSSDVIRAHVSRPVVDVERFADDTAERCSAVGMAANCTRTADGAVIRFLDAAWREALVQRYFWPHHRRLDGDAAATPLAKHGRCVILEAHSFPTVLLPTQAIVDHVPEIGIGTDALHTSKPLCDFAEKCFRARGFSAGVNIPFSGTLVPNALHESTARVESVMTNVRSEYAIGL